MYQVFYEVKERTLRDLSTPVEHRERLRTMQIPRFKMSDDLVDGDIVHYAIMGLHEHGRKRVSVITADDPGTVAHRLAYAKWLYLYSLSLPRISGQQECTRDGAAGPSRASR